MSYRGLKRQAKTKHKEKKIYYSAKEFEEFHLELHKTEKNIKEDVNLEPEEARKIEIKKVLKVLWLLIFPFAYKNKKVREMTLYDSVLQIGVGFVLLILGMAAWAAGIIIISYTLTSNYMAGVEKIPGICFGLSVLFMGSLVVMAALEFSSERRSDKIYNFSMSMLALISCIVSVIAVVIAVIGVN